MRTHDLPDISALGRHAYISGKSLVPMLQLLHYALHFLYKAKSRLSSVLNFKIFENHLNFICQPA